MALIQLSALRQVDSLGGFYPDNIISDYFPFYKKALLSNQSKAFLFP
jgi:hypothetical protein